MKSKIREFGLLTLPIYRMASQSEGIQRLLEAEAEAKKQLDHARRREY